MGLYNPLGRLHYGFTEFAAKAAVRRVVLLNKQIQRLHTEGYTDWDYEALPPGIQVNFESFVIFARRSRRSVRTLWEDGTSIYTGIYGRLPLSSPQSSEGRVDYLKGQLGVA